MSGSNGNGNGNGTRPMGRIPLFESDPHVRKTILEAVELGLSDKDACLLAGIHGATLAQWKTRQRSAYRNFREELQHARMKGKAHRIHAIRKAFARAEDPDWKAAAWLLARQYPEEFSEKRLIELRKKTTPSKRREAMRDPQIRADLERAAGRLDALLQSRASGE